MDAGLAIRERGIVDLKDVILSKDVGGKAEDTEFVEGIVIDKVALDKKFPLRIENPAIALIDTSMEIAKTANKAKLQINAYGDLEGFVKQEEEALFEMADYVIRAGANAVFCSKGMDDKIAATCKAGEFMQPAGLRTMTCSTL